MWVSGRRTLIGTAPLECECVCSRLGARRWRKRTARKFVSCAASPPVHPFHQNKRRMYIIYVRSCAAVLSFFVAVRRGLLSLIPPPPLRSSLFCYFGCRRSVGRGWDFKVSSANIFYAVRCSFSFCRQQEYIYTCVGTF